MAHVKITSKGKGDGHRIEVDGVDLSFAILSEGFKITLDENDPTQMIVHMQVAADAVEADLADALVEALREAS